MLPDDYIADCERRARRFQGTWDQGTSGSLAADSMRLLKERRELMQTIEEMSRSVRDAVAARMAATPSDDPKMVGYAPPQPSQSAGPPAEIAALHPNVTFVPAAPQRPAEFKPACTSASMGQLQLEEAWKAISEKANAKRAAADAREAIEIEEMPVVRPHRLIGIAGRAGSGKNTLATMVAGAHTIGFADPLYAALSAMLKIPESVLRNRDFKDRVIPWLGQTPRQMLQTLGHEWGRGMVVDSLWVQLCRRRLDSLAMYGFKTICIADVRYDNEADMIREHGGIIVQVTRGGESDDGHASERGITLRDGDRVVENTGTLEDIRLKAASL